MIGLCSVTFLDRKVEEAFALAKEAQLDAIEWEEIEDQMMPMKNTVNKSSRMFRFTRVCAITIL
ncbi:hypothetical protein HW423_07365 [Aerococcaceae bacterium INB8]|uniref:Uncharacterized protein n=1 Tax=Ruoffia halotolerans TaxID=2748684 RepID=A0A839A717_9LACT|nr:hypothetical protein [Ruoffia halotolerans]MBA5729600.1 hypothetical protein [Ruoffia halotolerans]